MDLDTFEEIVSVLARNGRPDLILELMEVKRQIVDEDYVPQNNRRDSLSNDEGSATDESIVFDVDEEGFHSLR